jgi:hypothetical protein
LAARRRLEFRAEPAAAAALKKDRAMSLTIRAATRELVDSTYQCLPVGKKPGKKVMLNPSPMYLDGNIPLPEYFLGNGSYQAYFKTLLEDQLPVGSPDCVFRNPSVSSGSIVPGGAKLAPVEIALRALGRLLNEASPKKWDRLRHQWERLLNEKLYGYRLDRKSGAFPSQRPLALLLYTNTVSEMLLEDLLEAAKDARVGSRKPPPLCSARSLAEALGQPYAAVESFLRRYRETYSDCYETVESPRENEPKFLYRTKDVWKRLLAHFGKNDGR